jgi:hypothetical protein
MRLYEVKTTEYNGEQQYSGIHILAAKDMDEARSSAREYFENWYEDGDNKHANPDSVVGNFQYSFSNNPYFQ